MNALLHSNTPAISKRDSERLKEAETESLHTQRLAVLAKVALAHPDSNVLLSDIVQVVKTILPASAASVILWDAVEDSFSVSVSTLPQQAPDYVLEKVRTKGGATRWIVEQQQLLVVNDVSQDRFGASAMLREHKLNAYLGVPLIFNGESLGVLYALDKKARDYHQVDIDFMTILGRRAATGIGLNRMLEASEKARERAEVLAQVSNAMIAHKDLNSLLQTSVNTVASSLPANRVMLLLFDQEAKEVSHFIKGGVGARWIRQSSYKHYQEGLSGWVLREQQTALSPKGSADPRESPEVQQVRQNCHTGSIIVAPLHYQSHVLGTLTAIRDASEEDFASSDVTLVETISNQLATAIENARLFDQVKRLAITDELTGINNRRHFMEQGQHELERRQRNHQPLSCIMFDIDHFKTVNDQHGHHVGDSVLREVTKRCHQNLRTTDIFGRYGGEEFSVLLPETSLEKAVQAAERLRQAIESPLIVIDKIAVSVTLTLGVATLSKTTTDLEMLLAQADKALYKGKAAGRNQVMASD